jgi:hypothetical protein
MVERRCKQVAVVVMLVVLFATEWSLVGEFQLN